MKNTKNFASRWGFILASVGSAVGMANVWGFPNKLGSNGGGAFLLIYLLFIFIFSYVGLPAEFAMGRRAAAHGEFRGQTHVAENENKQQINEQKCPAAVAAQLVGKAPDVRHADR